MLRKELPRSRCSTKRVERATGCLTYRTVFGDASTTNDISSSSDCGTVTYSRSGRLAEAAAATSCPSKSINCWKEADECEMLGGLCASHEERIANRRRAQGATGPCITNRTRARRKIFAMKALKHVVHKTADEIDQYAMRRKAEAMSLAPGEARQSIREVAQMKQYALMKRVMQPQRRRAAKRRLLNACLEEIEPMHPLCHVTVLNCEFGELLPDAGVPSQQGISGSTTTTGRSSNRSEGATEIRAYFRLAMYPSAASLTFLLNSRASTSFSTCGPLPSAK